jgi:hypothetical protein
VIEWGFAGCSLLTKQSAFGHSHAQVSSRRHSYAGKDLIQEEHQKNKQILIDRGELSS